MQGPLREKHSRISVYAKNAADPEVENHKSHFMREFTGKMLRPRSNMFCASLCSRNAHGHVATGLLREFTGKMPRQIDR